MIKVFFLTADQPISCLLPEMVHDTDIQKAKQADRMDRLYARTALRLISKNSYQHVADIDINYPDLALSILRDANKPWYFNNLVALTKGGKLRKSVSRQKQLRDTICGDVIRADQNFFLIMGSQLVPI
jgi:hypothetical protein